MSDSRSSRPASPPSVDNTQLLNRLTGLTAAKPRSSTAVALLDMESDMVSTESCVFSEPELTPCGSSIAVWWPKALKADSRRQTLYKIVCKRIASHVTDLKISTRPWYTSYSQWRGQRDILRQ